MIWHIGFEGPILGRGKTCFKDGAVVGLHRGAQAWEALVVGTKLYRVSVGIDRGNVTSLHCNCPYAKEGKRCKHMAALFYTLENQAKDVLEDDDTALSGRVDTFSSDGTEFLLQLAIDVNSTRCTALLLNHKAAGDTPEFSLDEFTLDDLPEDALSGKMQDVQGDNGAMKLLLGE